MSDISQQAPPYSLYLKKTGDEESLTFKAFVTLFLRTWPYLKPQWRHLLTWLGLRLSMELMLMFVVLVAFDLFNNKVLVGEKLQSSQASLLVLDVSYSSDYFDTIERKSSRKARKKAAPRSEEIKETKDADVPKLTSEQRRVVRDRLMVLFCIGGLIYLMLTPILDYYRTWILQRVNQFLRVTMVERAEHLSLRYHSHARTGDAIYRLYQDSAMITSVIERILLDPVIAIGQVIFSFLVLCLFSPILGILFLGSIIPMLWLIVWYTPRLQIRSRRARTTNSDLISRIQEGFAAIRIIKANRAEPVLRRRFDQDSTTALDAAFYLRVENILMRMLLLFLVGLMLIATQLLTAVWTIESDPTFLAGTVALVGFAVWNLGAFQSVQSRSRAFNYYIMNLARIWSLLQDMSVGLDRSFFLLDLKPDVVDEDDAVPIPDPIQNITYDCVTFGYDPDVPILKGIDLTADTGTITAVVGTTGSGKSTLMSLLLRLYDPDSGSITINGTNLKHLQIDSLRAGVAIALQQNTLFATTVADNIAYAASGVDRADVVAAATVACADDFIREMSHGYDTQLGERGGKLSTGQRQRLSIARAVVRDTPILILDEPTASLDAETEHQVLANLTSWGRERIVFLITHRLSTIRNADQMAFLEDGAIVELGDHDTLMAKPDGRYRCFVTAEIEAAPASEIPE